MALNGLLDVTLSVPDPHSLGEFWQRHGLLQTAPGVYGTESRPTQIRLDEGDHRHLSALHLSCESDSDLGAISTRLAGLGVRCTVSDSTLTCTDPVLGHRIDIQVGRPAELHHGGYRSVNVPGEYARASARALAVTELNVRPPRRLGHVVLGSPRIADSNAFYLEGLGYRISDQAVGANATFCRIERDHHNLLIHRSRVGFLNHYALEMDDIDAIGIAGRRVLAEDPEADVVGIGRHFLGSNVFWYLRDPSGNMFEFFADMDQIDDDEIWEREIGRRDWGSPEHPAPFSVWGPTEPETFFRPPDLASIAAARERRGLP